MSISKNSLPLPIFGKIASCCVDNCNENSYAKESDYDYCEEHYIMLLEEKANHYKKIALEAEQTKRKAEYDRKIKEDQAKQKLRDEAQDEYERMKVDFEEKNFIIGSKLCHIQSNGELEFKTLPEASYMFENMIFTTIDKKGNEKEESFFVKWRKDANRKQFDRIDFVPNASQCPDDVYNLFRGFEAEKLQFEMNDKERESRIKPIIELMGYLTGGYQEYLCMWLASIIQKPYQKTEVAQFIRDSCSLFTCGGGIGKNLFFEWFGNKILGEKYFHVISNNKELYSDFNGIFEGKLLVLVEETSGKDNHSNAGVLKSNTTKKKQVVNKKGINQYKVSDYTNWVFTTNEKNALPIRQEDRRFVCYDSNTTMRGNVDYFNNLVRLMEKEETQFAFFEYLKYMETYQSPIEFQANIPITPAYRDIRTMNAPIIEKWLSDKMTLDIIEQEQKSSFLYNHFCSWLHSIRDDCKPMSNMAFTQYLKQAVSCFSTRTKDGYTLLKGDRQNIIKELKKFYLLDNDYVYEECKSLPMANNIFI